MQIPHLRPAEYKRSRLPRNRRTVNRAYGGVLSGSAVRERFVDFVLIRTTIISNGFMKLLYGKAFESLDFGFVGSSEPSWWKSKRL